MALNVNSDGRIAEMLLELKRHLRTCKRCRGAIAVRFSDELCGYAAQKILDIAIRYDTLIPRRIAAKRASGEIVYACPDLAKHGRSYPMIAEPLRVTHVQDRLF